MRPARPARCRSAVPPAAVAAGSPALDWQIQPGPALAAFRADPVAGAGPAPGAHSRSAGSHRAAAGVAEESPALRRIEIWHLRNCLPRLDRRRS